MSEVQLPAAFDAVLRQLHTGARELFGVPSVTLTVVGRIARPFSDVLKVALEGPGVKTCLYVKVFRLKEEGTEYRRFMEARIRDDFREMERCFAQLTIAKGLGCVRPIACFPEHFAVVTEEGPGEPFHIVLARVCRPFASEARRRQMQAVCHGIGAWLRGFQEMTPDTLRSDVNAVREYVDIRLQRLVQNRRARFGRFDRDRTLRTIDTLVAASAIADFDEVKTHSDFSHGNILVHGTHVTVLDFAMAGRGLKYYDLAHLYMHTGLFALKPQYMRRSVEEVQQHLLTGFDPRLTAETPAFRLALLVNVVNHYAATARDSAGVSGFYNRYQALRHRAWLRRADVDLAVTA